MTAELTELRLEQAALRAIRQVLRRAAQELHGNNHLRDEILLADRLIVRLQAARQQSPAVTQMQGTLRRMHALRIGDLIANIESAPSEKRLDAVAEAASWFSDAAEFGARQEAEVANIAQEPSMRLDAPVSNSASADQLAVQASLINRYGAAAPIVRYVEVLAGGRSKRTLRVVLAPNKWLPDEMIFRCDRSISAQATQVVDEFAVLSTVHQHGLPVAEPLWLQRGAEGLGDYLAMRMLPGHAPGNYWSAAGVSPKLGLALADVLARLHRIPVHEVWPAAPEAARDCAVQMLAALKSGAGADSAMLSVELQGGIAWLSTEFECVEGPAVLVHGDTHFGNVLAEGDRITGLTDWEFAHAGHPAEDLAFCYEYIKSVMPWEAFIERYRSSGGAVVTDRQLRCFRLWGQVRNLAMTHVAVARVQAASEPDLKDLSHALHARAKLSVQVARALADGLVSRYS